MADTFGGGKEPLVPIGTESKELAVPGVIVPKVAGDLPSVREAEKQKHWDEKDLVQLRPLFGINMSSPQRLAAVHMLVGNNVLLYGPATTGKRWIKNHCVKMLMDHGFEVRTLTNMCEFANASSIVQVKDVSACKSIDTCAPKVDIWVLDNLFASHEDTSTFLHYLDFYLKMRKDPLKPYGGARCIVVNSVVPDIPPHIRFPNLLTIRF